MVCLGPVLTTVGGFPDEIRAVRQRLTWPHMTVEEAFRLVRARHQIVFHKGGETASFTVFNAETRSFPTGLAPFVLSNFPYPVQVQDSTGARYGEGRENVRPDMLRGVELRPYQIEAAHAALHYRRGIIQHSTGSGKTTTLSAILKALHPGEFPALVLVHTRFLLEQMANRLVETGHEGVEIYGGGHKETGRITVATIQSVKSGFQTQRPAILSLTSKAKTLCLDESHTASNQTNWDIGVNLPLARNRIGLTMQVEELPNCMVPVDYLSVGAIGPILHSIDPPELRKHGWQSQPALVMLPTPGRTFSRSWPACYHEGVVGDIRRNSADMLVAVGARNAGRKVLLFVWLIAHGEALLESFHRLGGDEDTIFLRGQNVVQRYDAGKLVQEKWTAKRVQDFVDGPGGKIVIGTSVIDEGADLPQTDVLILAVAGKAFRRLRQRVGRGLRPAGNAVTMVFDHEDTHSDKLSEHAAMRRHVWAYDQIPQLRPDQVKAYGGFEVNDYVLNAKVYHPPVRTAPASELSGGYSAYC